MSSSGNLTTYNSELVKCIEDLREQREELNRGILKDEEEKAKIQKVRLCHFASCAMLTGKNGRVCCLIQVVRGI
jgi:hypothetical protein